MTMDSLEDLCLSHVRRNFEYFVCVYDQGDETIKRIFWILQQSYSNIWLRHLPNEIMSPKYCNKVVNLVMNSALTELNIDRLLQEIPQRTSRRTTSILEAIIQKLKVMGYAIKKYVQYFKYEGFTEGYMTQIMSHIPNVRELEFGGSNCYDWILKIIGQYCINLQTLQIRHCQHVTDEGLKFLCQVDENVFCENRNLTHLSLLKCSVTSAGIAFALTHFICLEKLQISHTGRHILRWLRRDGEMLPSIKLTDLVMRNYNITVTEDVVLERTIKSWALFCPNIEKLRITLFKTSAVNACCEFPKLKEISFIIPNIDMNFPDFTQFFQVKGEFLTELSITYGIVSVSTLVRHCQNLASLSLMRTSKFMDPPHSFTNLSPLVHLEYLLIQTVSASQDLCPEVYSLLRLSINLKSLTLSCVNLSCESVNFILNCHFMRALKKIILRSMFRIGCEPLCALAKNVPSLKSVAIHRDIMSDRNFAPFLREIFSPFYGKINKSHVPSESNFNSFEFEFDVSN